RRSSRSSPTPPNSTWSCAPPMALNRPRTSRRSERTHVTQQPWRRPNATRPARALLAVLALYSAGPLAAAAQAPAAKQPAAEAEGSSIETVQSSRRPPNRDYYVTRLIPLRYIDADSIVNTLKPLVSKDAAMAAYPPTNTVILTESASNIRRLIQILESIDVETYKEDLAVINVEYADATTLADQVSEIYGAEVAEAP